ncbi:MAG: response regulator [Flavobacteriales bacterium]|nr:response regulator [Flavobacteriales bacterium]
MKTILVVEDNLEIRENLTEILELDGYNVISAEDGKQGVALAQEHLPDLILCDIMMPNLDGYGVIHMLSRNPMTMRIPFIFLTAKTEKVDIRKGMSLGADDYIVKPFDETDLLLAIENRLKKYELISQNTKPTSAQHQVSFDFENSYEKIFDRKELVYHEGETATNVYKLISGKIKLTRLSSDGKEMVLDLLKPGDYFGYWSVLQQTETTENAEVLEDSKVLLIPTDDFKKLIESETDVASKFIKMLSNNLLVQQYKIVELAYESVRKRVANALIYLADTYTSDPSKPFSMAISRETLAGIAGTSVESAIRMLSEFKKDGLVEVDKATITVVNYQKLKTAPY